MLVELHRFHGGKGRGGREDIVHEIAVTAGCVSKKPVNLSDDSTVKTFTNSLLGCWPLNWILTFFFPVFNDLFFFFLSLMICFLLMLN